MFIVDEDKLRARFPLVGLNGSVSSMIGGKVRETPFGLRRVFESRPGPPDFGHFTRPHGAEITTTAAEAVHYLAEIEVPEDDIGHAL